MNNKVQTKSRNHSRASQGLWIGMIFGILIFHKEQIGVGMALGMLSGYLIGAIADTSLWQHRIILAGASLGAIIGMAIGITLLPNNLILAAVTISAGFGTGIGAVIDRAGRMPAATLTGAALGAIGGLLIGLLLGWLHGAHYTVYGSKEIGTLFGHPFISDYLALAVIAGAIGMGLGARIDVRKVSMRSP